jgi:hypothetical protein
MNNKMRQKSTIEEGYSLRIKNARMPVEWKVKRVAELQKISLKARPLSGPEDRRMVWNAD